MSVHLFGISDRTYSYSHSVGRNEFAGTGFRNPVDFVCSSDDTLYVLNRSYESRNDGIHITVATLDEQYITEFGTYGDGEGQWVWPAGIAIDSDDQLYITDEYLNRITIYDTDGDYIGTWGSSGAGDGELSGPTGITILGDSAYVVDSKNHRVQIFGLDGAYKGQFGGFGTDNGQFNMPWGIADSTDGIIYVTDWRNDRVQGFDTEGVWQISFGTTGDSYGEFNRPTGIGVDSQGDIYVCDWMNNRVQSFAPDGRYIAQFLGDHKLSAWGKDKLMSNQDMIRQRALAYSIDPDYETKLAHPDAVKVNADGKIMISDSTRGRIQVYQKHSDPIAAFAAEI